MSCGDECLARSAPLLSAARCCILLRQKELRVVEATTVPAHKSVTKEIRATAHDQHSVHGQQVLGDGRAVRTAERARRLRVRQRFGGTSGVSSGGGSISLFLCRGIGKDGCRRGGYCSTVLYSTVPVPTELGYERRARATPSSQPALVAQIKRNIWTRCCPTRARHRPTMA